MRGRHGSRCAQVRQQQGDCTAFGEAGMKRRCRGGVMVPDETPGAACLLLELRPLLGRCSGNDSRCF